MSLSRKAAKAQDHKIREQLKRMDNIAVALFLLFRCVWPLLAGVSWRYGHYLGGISIALDTSLVSGLLAKIHHQRGDGNCQIHQNVSFPLSQLAYFYWL